MTGHLRKEALFGSGWFAQRTPEGASLSVPTGKWDSGDLTFAITSEEFDRLRTEADAVRDIVDKYNKAEGEGWSAQREDSCVVYLLPSHFADTRRFQIPNEAFERLRDDPALFDEIYAAHHADYP